MKGVDGAPPSNRSRAPGSSAGSAAFPKRICRDLSKNMQDLDWLAAATTRHQQVVPPSPGPQISFRRASESNFERVSLASHIESRRAALKADFQRLQGKQEWGVKVFALPAAPLAKKKFRTGKEYLQAKSALSRPASGLDRSRALGVR